MVEPGTAETCPICLQHYGDEPMVVLTEKSANRVNISSKKQDNRKSSSCQMLKKVY